MSTDSQPFTSEDQEVIAATAARMKIFGYLLIVSLILTLAVTFIQIWMVAQFPLAGMIGVMIGALIPVAISGAIAWYTLRAAGAMEMAARDPNSSPQPIGETIRELKRLFGFQYALIVILICFVLAAMVIGALVAMLA